MKLTNRMQTIVSLIDNGSNVIDIGCDHALVDIYLSLYNKYMIFEIICQYFY